MSGSSSSWSFQKGALSWVAAAVLVGGLVLVIMASFLWLYPRRGLSVPLGWDTARYLWRTALVRDFGFAQLPEVVPPYLRPDPARPAFPVLASTLSSLLHVSIIELSALLPAIGAAAVGLAAAAFVGAGLRRPPSHLALVGLGVGISVFVVRMAGPEGYQDMLFASAVLLAAATSIVLASEDRRALVPAVLLLGAGGVTHWAFFLIMAATVGLTAVLYLPGSLARWRRGEESLLDTPSARLGGVLLGASAVTTGVMLGILSATPNRIIQSPEVFARKLRRTARGFMLPIIAPLAAAGLVSVWREERRAGERRDRVRFMLIFLLAWCAVVLAGILANLVLHLRVAGHRFLAFGLAIVVLEILGIVWLSELVRMRVKVRALARVLAALVVIVGLGGSVGAAAFRWSRMRPVIKAENLREATAAGAYLSAARVPEGHPVVFVVANKDWSYFSLMGHMTRAGLPPARVRDAYFYAGSPDDYLRRRPTLDRSHGGLPGLSRHYFKNIKGIYGRNPVGLILSSYNRSHYRRWASRHPSSIVAPGVAVVRGPLLSSPPRAPRAPLVRLTYKRVTTLAVALMAVLVLVGLGWTLALLGVSLRPLEILTLSPAVGIAFLVLAGVLVDSLGVRLSGPGGVLTPLLVGGAGWGVAGWVHLRRRGRGVVTPEGSQRAAGRGEPADDASAPASLAP